MIDRIAITGLRVQTRIGVSDEERAHPQTVIVDIGMNTDVSTAAESDDVTDTVDYHRVASDVEAVVKTNEVRLLEALASRVAETVLAHEGVCAVAVEVRKEQPPIDQDIAQVSVRVTRQR